MCPGIRPGSNTEDLPSIQLDDQKRKTTVEEAFRNGADYIVVGRPICGADNPKAAADEIQQMIAAVFAR